MNLNSTKRKKSTTDTYRGTVSETVTWQADVIPSSC